MIGFFAVEYKTFFLFEKRTELYEKYCDGVSQKKKMFCAKSDLIDQTCFDLESAVRKS